MPLNKEYGDVDADAFATGGPEETAVAATFTNSLVEGKPLADDGELYPTVQDAENAASSWVFVPPGTFNEGVTIDTAGLSLVGAGRGSYIDASGSNAAAIEVDAADVTIQDLRLTADATDNKQGIITLTNADRMAVIRCEIDGAQDGVRANSGTNHLIAGCKVENTDAVGLNAFALDSILAFNIMGNTVGADGIKSTQDDVIIVGNIINGVGGDGLRVDGNDQVIGYNRVLSVGSIGVDIRGTDQILFNNRISDSANSDISSGNATALTTDANLTGSAN